MGLEIIAVKWPPLPPPPPPTSSEKHIHICVEADVFNTVQSMTGTKWLYNWTTLSLTTGIRQLQISARNNYIKLYYTHVLGQNLSYAQWGLNLPPLDTGSNVLPTELWESLKLIEVFVFWCVAPDMQCNWVIHNHHATFKKQIVQRMCSNHDTCQWWYLFFKLSF